MDINAVLTGVIATATAGGGFMGGRRSAHGQDMQIANDTVDMLQAQIESLKDDKTDRDAEVTDLRVRVEILESLVTQRAEVEIVHEGVLGIRSVVDRIAEKVGVNDGSRRA